jgi:hypothetical protein
MISQALADPDMIDDVEQLFLEQRYRSLAADETSNGSELSSADHSMKPQLRVGI